MGVPAACPSSGGLGGRSGGSPTRTPCTKRGRVGGKATAAEQTGTGIGAGSTKKSREPAPHGRNPVRKRARPQKPKSNPGQGSSRTHVRPESSGPKREELERRVPAKPRRSAGSQEEQAQRCPHPRPTAFGSLSRGRRERPRCSASRRWRRREACRVLWGGGQSSE